MNPPQPTGGVQGTGKALAMGSPLSHREHLPRGLGLEAEVVDAALLDHVEIGGHALGDVTKALQRLDPVWDELFPAEQQRLVQLLVAQVDVFTEAVKVHLRAQGLDILSRELNDLWNTKEEAA